MKGKANVDGKADSKRQAQGSARAQTAKPVASSHGKGRLQRAQTESEILGFEITRTKPAGFDRQERRHAKSKGHQDFGGKAPVHEGRANQRDLGQRRDDVRREPLGRSDTRQHKRGSTQTAVSGRTILHTYKAGEMMGRSRAK